MLLDGIDAAATGRLPTTLSIALCFAKTQLRVEQGQKQGQKQKQGQRQKTGYVFAFDLDLVVPALQFCEAKRNVQRVTVEKGSWTGGVGVWTF